MAGFLGSPVEGRAEDAPKPVPLSCVAAGADARQLLQAAVRELRRAHTTSDVARLCRQGLPAASLPDGKASEGLIALSSRMARTAEVFRQWDDFLGGLQNHVREDAWGAEMAPDEPRLKAAEQWTALRAKRLPRRLIYQAYGMLDRSSRAAAELCEKAITLRKHQMGVDNVKEFEGSRAALLDVLATLAKAATEDSAALRAARQAACEGP